ARLAAELSELRQHLLRQVLGGRLPATAAARGVLDEMKVNEPQDLAMLSAGLAEIRRVMGC
ncbi:MAG TPA: hypothetical protein DIT03_05050, partial [Candidatus Accumulibacter sp.]|nr:hypothetical protein [Accumulibacter sp.]